MPDEQDSTSTFEIPEEEFAAAVSPLDLKGRINLRIEQALQQEIENLAEDKRYPLNSASEVVRYCCLLGIERLRAWKPAPTLLGSIKAANALVIRDKMQCESLELLDRLDERMSWYLTRGHHDEAIELVARIRGHFDNFTDQFWAQHIQSEIDKRCILWMDQIESASNLNTSEGQADEH